MGTVRKTFPHRPNHVAVVDADTHKILRWEEKGERENPHFEAKNPSELVIQENPSESDHKQGATMERENAVTEVANEFLEKAKPGLGIVAGNAVAAEFFEYIDRGPLNAQGTTVRKIVRVFGPGVAGVIVGRMSDSELVRAFALGHVTESVRAGVEEALAFVSNGEMGESKGEDNGSNGNGSTEQPESGTEGWPALNGRSTGELAGGYSSQTEERGVEMSGQTVM